MSLRKKLEEKILKKEQEIREHESSIREARSYIQAIQDSLKLVSKTDGAGDIHMPSLREGSMVAQAYEFIKKRGNAVSATDILKGIGKDPGKANRISLTGSLSSYVRSGKIFSRPSPGKFGLVEFSKTNNGNEPPDDFGVQEIGDDSV
jgi:hypothetical protein